MSSQRKNRGIQTFAPLWISSQACSGRKSQTNMIVSTKANSVTPKVPARNLSHPARRSEAPGTAEDDLAPLVHHGSGQAGHHHIVPASQIAGIDLDRAKTNAQGEEDLTHGGEPHLGIRRPRQIRIPEKPHTTASRARPAARRTSSGPLIRLSGTRLTMPAKDPIVGAIPIVIVSRSYTRL